MAALLPGVAWLAETDRQAAVDMIWRDIRIDVKGARFLLNTNGSRSWSFSMRAKQVSLVDVFVLVALDVEPPKLWAVPSSAIPSGRRTRIAIYRSRDCRWNAYAASVEDLPAAIERAKEVDHAAQG